MAARFAIEVLIFAMLVALAVTAVVAVMRARHRAELAEKRYRAALAEHEKDMIEWDSRQREGAK